MKNKKAKYKLWQNLCWLVRRAWVDNKPVVVIYSLSAVICSVTIDVRL